VTDVTQPELLIRRFNPSDAAGLNAYLSRPEVVRFEPYGVQSAADCVRLAAERAASPDFWAVCLRSSGELVGNLYFQHQEPAEWRTYELGYVFHPDHWGRGYASRAASALVNAAFSEGNAHRVQASCNPDNVASWRLLERIGFRREGHLLRNASFDMDADGAPVWQDTYVYAVLVDEWRQAAASGVRLELDR
jgi:RimJ/RimL family protein N-acetyltransferase